MRDFRSIFVLGVALSGCLAHAQYTFVDLHETSHNQTVARAKFANNIAGYLISGASTSEVLTWKGMGRTPTYLSGATEGDAFAVWSNNIVGWLKNDQLAHRAFIWNARTGSLVDLSPAGAHASIAYGVYANQQVGSMYTVAGERATIWSGTAQSAVDIHPVGYGNSLAYCTNGSSQAGYATVNGVAEAVLWNGNPLAVPLQPAGYGESMVLSMYQGIQVGRARLNGNNHAIRWAGTAASAVDLNPSGYDDSGAMYVWNNKIVGWGRNENDFRFHALVWDVGTNTATSLNSYLPPEYTDAQAMGIDPVTGDIVGMASDGFQLRAVMWKADSNNQPPVLDPVGDQTIDEDSESRISMTGSDPDSGDTLTFELGPAPSGVAIESNGNGVAELVWSPSETQAPGVFQVTVYIIDNRGGEDSETFTITVTEVNQPPDFHTVPEDVTITEGDLFKIDIDGSDIDIPAQTLTFSLVSGPAGLTVGTDGIICWQTDETHGGQTYPVTIELSDGVDAVQASMNIHVDEINTPPDVVNPGEQTVLEEETLTLQIQASDTDQPAQTLTYYLDEGGAGMNFDPDTGVLTWTPTEEDGPQTRSVQISVSDGVDATIINFDIVVGEVNLPPSIGTDGDLEVDVDQELTFTATASDPDVPANTLTFSLDGAPDGATIDPSTGEFSWTPTEAGAFTFDVVVTDDGEPPLSASETITVTVTGPQNQPPVLAPIGAKSLDELTALVLDADATDPDSGQTLTYSLLNTPAGMTIDPSSGVVSWTPAEAQGPQVYSVTVMVTDDGDPAESDMEIVLITVNEVNQTPNFAMGTTYTVDEGQLLTIVANATDDDLPAQTLTFSIVDQPAGMTINALTGVILWTPTEAQGPGSYTFDLIVSDGNGGFASMPIYVTVNEVEEINAPPVLDVIEDKTVREELLLMFTPVASDPDAGQTLTYSLSGDVPYGAYIQPDTGLFTYRPAAVQTPSTHVVTVTVTDNGIPALSASRSFTINALREDRTINRLWAWGIGNLPGHDVFTDLGGKSATRTKVFVGASKIFGGKGEGVLARYPDLSWKGSGPNNWGQLGSLTPGNTWFLREAVIPDLQGMIEVSLGIVHGVGLNPGGWLYTWGHDSFGQRGDGGGQALPFTRAAFRLGPPHRLGSAPRSSIFLTTHQYGVYGSLVYVTGLNNGRQLGTGSSDSPSAFVARNPTHRATQTTTHFNDGTSLADNGTVFTSGSHYSVGTSVFATKFLPEPVVQIASGYYTTYALTNSGRVYAWGRNDFGQIGDGTLGYVTLLPTLVTITEVVQIAAAGDAAYAVRSDGTVWSWGRGVFSGHPNTSISYPIPTQIPGLSGVERIEANQSACFAWSYGSVATPIANAGSDVTVQIPHDGSKGTNTYAVTLDGTASSDPDNEALTYEWRKGSFLLGTGPTPTFNLTAGVHVITLKVRDESWLDSTDTVTVTVLPEPNVPPVAQGETIGMKLGESLDVNLLMNDIDPDGDAMNVRIWNYNFNGWLYVSPGVYRFLPTATGDFYLVYSAVDSYGATSSQVFLSIKVTDDSGIRR